GADRLSAACRAASACSTLFLRVRRRRLSGNKSMTRRRWYEAQGGLRFRCTQCGKWCARPGYILVHPDESAALAARFRDGAKPADLEGVLWTWDDACNGWLSEVEEGESCPFLIDEQCSVHDVKPRQCATYPFWEEIIGNRLTW